MKTKRREIQILPSPQEADRAPVRQSELERLVQEQVAQIMADRDALVFEPFFRSRQIAFELRRLQTVPEQRKWSVYYERYGCLVCETQGLPHFCNGMCKTCRLRIFGRLTQIIAEGIKGEPAIAARGLSAAQRQLPENAVRDAVHHTWYQPRVRKGKS